MATNEKPRGIFDMESHYVFYGSYHNDMVNRIIHIFFVWPILFTALLLLQYTSTLFRLPEAYLAVFPPSISHLIVINGAAVLCTIYVVFYTAMGRGVGPIAALLVVVCWLASRSLFINLGPENAWKVGVVAQIVSWGSQFIGHGVFEGRAPALLDNLFQAIFMAPLFVLLELLHILFGFEPSPGFQKRVQHRVDAAIKQWKQKKAN